MTDFAFHSVWELDASADRVYSALADVANYARWWPQVRDVSTIDAGSGVMTIRSAVPWTFRIVGRRAVEDPMSRYLRATLSGAMTGWSSWTIQASGVRSRAYFEQEVTVVGNLGVLSHIAKPLFAWNHELMMSGGCAGLSRYLR
ncbi:SRPBCC family protein [Rhodococcus sp. 27YEA15]|uniref:SRPBCC family protein n=1 Tax=Rhodococcus sp. 27YEA15 TaxID=3156259 RepID=UPI003C7E4A30